MTARPVRTSLTALVLLLAAALGLALLTPVQADAAEPWLDEDFSSGVDGVFDTGGTSVGATADGHLGGGAVSRIAKGAHWGSAAHWVTQTNLGFEPEEMWMRYYIKFPDGFRVDEPYRGKIPGFGGLYSGGCRGGKVSKAGDACWSARMSFSPLYVGDGLPSKPVDPDKVTRVGFYAYLLNNSDVGQTGEILNWDPDVSTLDHGRWYCIEGRVAMNSLGQSNGVLEGYVDGKQAFAASNLRFRRAAESNLKVKSLWFDVYYGGDGTSPVNNEIYFDSIAAGPERIGCNDGATHNGRFYDDDTSPFEPNIENLAASGITQGCNPPANDKFCPGDSVKRGQMSAFLYRALKDDFDVTLPPKPASPPDFWGGKTARTYTTALEDYEAAGAGWDTFIVSYPIDEIGTDRDWLGTGFNPPTKWVPIKLENIWQRGATPYVQVTVNDLRKLAGGTYNSRVNAMLATFAEFTSQGGGRRVILDVLPEANNSSRSYGDDPTRFKAAFTDFVAKARAKLGNKVRIAFTQNHELRSTRYSKIDYGNGGYGLYWPGTGAADFAGITGYSDSSVSMYESAVDELATVVGGDMPLFLSLAGRASVPSEATQMGFISDLVALTKTHPQMMGVQWHDADYQGRDMRTSTNSGVDAGYPAAVNGGQTGGIDWLFSGSADSWASARRAYAPFTDITGSVFTESIRWLAATGITKGCTPTTFCPTKKVTRGQMAAFLARALKLPAPPTPIIFDDTSGHTFEDAISRLAHAGITNGCSATSFCPDKYVTRGQMAAFLDRAGLTK